MLNWTVHQVISDTTFGFHDSRGVLYVMNYFGHWIGRPGDNGRFLWTAGNTLVKNSGRHIRMDLENPHYITDTPDGKLLISSAGNKKIYRLDPESMSCTVLIDGNALGMSDVGNCVFDKKGTIWINEIQGCRLWQFTAAGVPVNTLGSGQPGFQPGECGFNDAEFHWIYDIRNGPDGNIYVLDSKNFAVRMLDVRRKMVKTIAGTGKSGYTGDGGSARLATFGSNPSEFFDGPWSMSLDEKGNIFVGDTQNHVVRMIEKKTGVITTIAGNSNAAPGMRNSSDMKDPLSLNLPKICSMDYWNGKLYIPEWGGDVFVLSKHPVRRLFK